MTPTESRARDDDYRDKPIADQLRGLGNFSFWCSENTKALGDPARWFAELTAEIRRIAAIPAGWRPMETAPKDGTRVLLWATAREGLPAFVTIGAYHPSAGWCVDELREVTHWQSLPGPPEAAP